jgi:ribosome-associated toxin RatA of RatAB toxin-antitoxin module
MVHHLAKITRGDPPRSSFVDIPMKSFAPVVVLWVLHLPALSPASAKERVYVVEAGGQPLEVRISERFGETAIVQAECTLPQRIATVWRVLSDYEGLDSLVSAVTESRVVRHEANGARILYQQGRAGLWFIKLEFQVWFRVEEEPLSRITFRAIEGDFRRFEGFWEITEKDGGTGICHHVEIKPRFYAPTWAIRMVAVRLMTETIQAVIHRCLDGGDL